SNDTNNATSTEAPAAPQESLKRTHALLPGRDWAIWRQVALRGAGFPAAGVTGLSSPALAQAADDLLTSGADPQAPRDRRDPGPWARYLAAFDTELTRQGAMMADLIERPRLQLALAWQNHRIFDTAIGPMRRHAGHRGTKHRQHEALIANYWQRYCLKNDTIGFFGPVGWTTLDPAAAITQFRPGAGLIASSEVFFETWIMDRLAEMLAADPALAEWVAPKRLPFVRLDAGRAIGPAVPPTPLDPTERAVLALCTGTTPARDIARRVANGGTPNTAPSVTPNEVFAIIDRLRRKRLITWKLELPLSMHPEHFLRRFLGHVGDQALAEAGLARLDRLEAAREKVREANLRADPAALVDSLRALDGVFVAETGVPPNRNSGCTYGARTLVYHDARRDVQMTLGADFMATLAPLELLLHSGRWLTYQLGQELRATLTKVAGKLAARKQQAQIDLASFWFECLPVIHRSAPATMARLQAEFQRRWIGILACPPDVSKVRITAEQVRDQVLATFEAPRSGWAAGRYCSPDLMIAADSVGAINRGDFELILGEFHLGLASCRHYCFVSQHPAPQQLHDCMTVDNPGPRLLPVQPRESSGRLTIRTQPGLTRDQDYLAAIFEQTTDPARPRVLAAADLTVDPGPEGPTVTVPDGPTFDVIDLFAEMLVNVVVDSVALLPHQPHRPRITLDKLVVCRETWRFPVPEIGFAAIKDEAARFAAARQWRSERHLPRQTFVKVPGELKPFYVDFDSLFSVNLLAKFVRKRASAATASQDGKNGKNGAATPASDPGQIQFSEMLPDTSQLWLADRDGQRYTSELRIVAVDQRGPIPGRRSR
ncbi:MAG: lantibiotic dehydratase, partial [Streptosporangiaceae bacterium]